MNFLQRNNSWAITPWHHSLIKVAFKILNEGNLNVNLTPAKECTRHESPKDSFKYYTDKHPYTLLLKTCISLKDIIGNCEMSPKKNNNNMRSKESCSLIENDMVLASIIPRKQYISTSHIRIKNQNNQWINHMFFNQQGRNIAIWMFKKKTGIVTNTYNSKLGRLRQEEHKLKVSLGYIVRPCLKSHKRKEKKATKSWCKP